MAGNSNDIYKEDIDFAALALQDADFAKVLKKNGQLDFTDPASVQQLTKSLLKRDFGLEIELPHDRLCPPVPNRLNYLLWIQGLLDTTSRSHKNGYEPDRKVIGLDIGTGASCIYPLLGCSQRPNWNFVGTDIDEKSLEFAKKNVEINGLQLRIKLLRNEPSDTLIEGTLEKLALPRIDFCMCNPPFYTSKEEMVSSAAAKQRPAFTACTGSENEMIYPGGEVAFISRMVQESATLTSRVQWYSSMLGKYSSISEIVKQLQELKVGNYAVTTFVQGTKTRRWAIAWSFDDLRPEMELARGVPSLQKMLLPFPSAFVLVVENKSSEVVSKIHQALSVLPMVWNAEIDSDAEVVNARGFCEEAVWSRSSRRHYSVTKEQVNAKAEADFAFGFTISVEASPGGQTSYKVTLRWLKGCDRVIFESFCGMIKAKLE